MKWRNFQYLTIIFLKLIIIRITAKILYNKEYVETYEIIDEYNKK